MILWWQPITGLSPPPVTVLPRQSPTPGASGDSFSPLLGAYGDDLRHRDLPLADSCSFQNSFWHSFSLLVFFCVYFISSPFKQCLLPSFESSPTILLFIFFPEFLDSADVEGFHQYCFSIYYFSAIANCCLKNFSCANYCLLLCVSTWHVLAHLCFPFW